MFFERTVACHLKLIDNLLHKKNVETLHLFQCIIIRHMKLIHCIKNWASHRISNMKMYVFACSRVCACVRTSVCSCAVNVYPCSPTFSCSLYIPVRLIFWGQRFLFCLTLEHWKSRDDNPLSSITKIILSYKTWILKKEKTKSVVEISKSFVFRFLMNYMREIWKIPVLTIH